MYTRKKRKGLGYTFLITALCLLTGCPTPIKPVVPDRPVGPTNAEIIESLIKELKAASKKQLADLRQQNAALADQIKSAIDSGKPKDVPSEPVSKDQIDSYEKVTRLFQEKTGKTWRSFSNQFNSARANFETKLELPDTSDLREKIEEISEANGNTASHVADAAKLILGVDALDQKAGQAKSAFDELKQTLQPTVDKIQAVVEQVERLKTNPADGSQVAQELIDQKLPQLYDAIGELESGLESQANAAKSARDAFTQAYEDLKRLIVTSSLPSDTKESITKVAEKVSDDFSDDLDKVAAGIEAVAAAAPLIAQAFQINPYLGAAVAVIVFLAAVFGSQGEGGGGDGEGSGSESGDESGTSEAGDGSGQDGGTSSGGNNENSTSTPGDPNVTPNAGPPTSVPTAQPAISGTDSGIGSKIQSENGPWYRSKWQGDTLVFQLVFKRSDGSTHERQFSIDNSTNSDVARQLKQARDGGRNLNVTTITYDSTLANGGFPYEISISGFDQGELSFRLESEGQPIEIRGL